MTSLLILAAACGKAGQPTATPYREELKTDGSNISGNYTAQLYPVNINLHAPSAGKASMTRTGDELIARVKLEVGSKGANYRQAIYWGNRCPGVESDTNKDGWIDMTEMESGLGDVIIPLDGNIDSQSMGTGQYPNGFSGRGGYFYKKTASFSRFFEDLKSPDENTHDRVMKLGDNSGFTFLGKVILVQGTTEDYNIPDSVSSYYGLSRIRSLPIACGVFFKASDVVSDEAETPVLDSGVEPGDSTNQPDPTPTPDVNPIPNPSPAPTHPAPTHPTPAPTDDSDDDEDDDDDNDVGSRIRDWWNHVTGNDDDGDDHHH